MTARAPVYENMKFPVYVHQEYPKAITIPPELEDKFDLIPMNTSNMVFSHDRDGNEFNKPSRKYARQVQVNSAEEEEAVLAKIKKFSMSATKPSSDK